MKNTNKIIYKLAVAAWLILHALPGLGQEKAPGHGLWDQVLATYVDAQGAVDYAGMLEDRKSLEAYLNQLAAQLPESSWSQNEKLAYWINAYNAFTVSLILDHYPLKSIMEIEQAWELEFISLGNRKYSLNYIEHEIIRQEFDEPRIHFALVCAAASCPVLLNKAYDAATLEQQLQEQASSFINDENKNRIRTKKIAISQIFNWFNSDFTKEGTLINYLNRYATEKISEEATVEFMEYDWGLNGE